MLICRGVHRQRRTFRRARRARNVDAASHQRRRAFSRVRRAPEAPGVRGAVRPNDCVSRRARGRNTTRLCGVVHDSPIAATGPSCFRVRWLRRAAAPVGAGRARSTRRQRRKCCCRLRSRPACCSMARGASGGPGSGRPDARPISGWRSSSSRRSRWSSRYRCRSRSFAQPPYEPTFNFRMARRMARTGAEILNPETYRGLVADRSYLESYLSSLAIAGASTLAAPPRRYPLALAIARSDRHGGALIPHWQCAVLDELPHRASTRGSVLRTKDASITP